MLETLYNFFVDGLTKSDFTKGGIVLAISSYLLYKIPALFWSGFEFIKQRTISTVKFNDYGTDWIEFCQVIKPYMSNRHLSNMSGVNLGTYYSMINNRPSIIYCYTDKYMNHDRVTIYIESFFTSKLVEFITKAIEQEKKKTKTISIYTTNDIETAIKADTYSLPTENCHKLDKLIGNFKKSGLKKLGILLYGPPGNGKTQSILNVCKKQGISLLSVQINKHTTSYQLAKLGWYKDRITILEDIDRLSLVQSDQIGDENYIISKADLLNILDGINSNDGIVIATANDISKIDPAILREGRFDIKIEFSNPSDEDIKNIYTEEYNKECPQEFITEHSGKSVAEVFNSIKLSKIHALETMQEIPLESIPANKESTILQARPYYIQG